MVKTPSWSSKDEAILLELFRTEPHLSSAQRARKFNSNPSVTYNKRTKRAVSDRLGNLLAEETATSSSSSEEHSSGQEWSGAEDEIPEPETKRRVNPARLSKYRIAPPTRSDEVNDSEVEIVELPKPVRENKSKSQTQSPSSTPPVKPNPSSTSATLAPPRNTPPAPPSTSASASAPARTVGLSTQERLAYQKMLLDENDKLVQDLEKVSEARRKKIQSLEDYLGLDQGEGG